MAHAVHVKEGIIVKLIHYKLYLKADGSGFVWGPADESEVWCDSNVYAEYLAKKGFVFDAIIEPKNTCEWWNSDEFITEAWQVEPLGSYVREV